MAENQRELRRKIDTTDQIWQMTRAMSMVSRVQLQRVEETTRRRSEYLDQLDGIIRRVGGSDLDFVHPYYQPVEDPDEVGMVFAAGDRGLCGTYNRNVGAIAEQYIAEAGCRVKVIVIGEKACQRAERNHWNVIREYPELGAVKDAEVAGDVAHEIRQMFDEGRFEVLQMVYTEFRGVSDHQAMRQKILPVPTTEVEREEELEYIFEPDEQVFLERLLPMAVEARIAYNLVQSLASEHAARMIAMRTASDNAEEMKEDLTQRLNRARQQKITREVLDVITGAEAVSS